MSFWVLRDLRSRVFSPFSAKLLDLKPIEKKLEGACNTRSDLVVVARVVDDGLANLLEKLLNRLQVFEGGGLHGNLAIGDIPLQPPAVMFRH